MVRLMNMEDTCIGAAVGTPKSLLEVVLTKSDEVELNRLHCHLHHKSISRYAPEHLNLTLMVAGLHFGYGTHLWDIGSITLTPSIVRVRNSPLQMHWGPN